MVLTGGAKGAWGYVAALGIGLAFAGSLRAENRPQSSPSQPLHAAQDQNDAKATTPPRQPALTISKADEKIGAKDKSAAVMRPDETYAIKWTDKVVAASAAASALFALVLAWFTYRLIVVGRDQHKASMDALKHSMVSSERQLRAYVTVRNVALSGRGPPAESYAVRIEWLNSGNTPATRTALELNRRTFEGGVPDDFDYVGGDAGSGRSVIGPGVPRWIEGDISPAELVPIAAGTHTMLFWGWLEYNDVFENTPRRRTEVSFRVMARGDPLKKAELWIANNPLFNGSDEDCYRGPQTT